MIDWDDFNHTWYCTVCDMNLEHGDRDSHEDCPGG